MIAKPFAASILCFALLVSSPGQASDEPHVAPIKALVADKLSAWLSDPVLIEAIRAQNVKHASLTQADINALDKDWRAQVNTPKRPLVDSLLSAKLSGFLVAKKKESGGLITEVFVMDDKGLNVGQSDVTSDYWQGDEAKWQKTFLAGPGAIFVDKVEKDESTQMLQSQVSVTVVDPRTKTAIGAITIGVNVDAL
jgi:hypothetical protein